MWIPSDENRYTSAWKYIELARYVPEKERVLREMAGKHKPRLVEWGDVEQFRRDNNNTGIYTSVFHYNDTDLTRATRFGPLYFDLDSKQTGESQADAVRLVDNLLSVVPESALRIYFTGKKGFHVEVEPIAAGITPSQDLPNIFRYIASDLRDRLSLSTLDFQVYDLRRIWRLPGSRHQDTGLFKHPLSIEELGQGMEYILQVAEEPGDLSVPDQEFDLKLNEWFRDYTYRVEEEKKKRIAPQELVERFEKYGTSKTRSFNDNKQFNAQALFEGCDAINRLWNKAENKRHLEHEERLFLCSILTYTDEAIWYLHQILGNCHDYNFEKTQAHIDDWVKRRELEIGGRPFSCERANAAGIGCGGCDLEPRKKWVKAGNSWVETDEVSKPSPIRFAYKKDRDAGNVRS